MGFKPKLEQDLILATKAKDRARQSALRLIKTALHNKEIDLRRDLNDTEFLQLLSGMVKQRKDSIEQFARGGRTDLVEKEEGELRVIQEFMPQQMSDADIEKEIEEVIKEVGATMVKDMGKVMKVLMPKLTGKADGKVVGEKVKAKLSSS